MSIDSGNAREAEWKPGVLGRIRAALRRALLAIFGDRGERRFHGWYHRFLRAADRFDPPEDGVSAAMLCAIAARSSTIIDVGANVGRYSWFLRRNAAAQSTLFALEPHHGAAELLRYTIGGIPGCTVLELAASDADGTASLMVPDGAFGSPVSGLAWIQGGADKPTRTNAVVEIRRLDSLIDDGTITITVPAFLKIDVEGGERSVLRGAVDLLWNCRPIIYFECQATSLARHGETPEDVWADLRQAGYRIYANRSGRFGAMAAADASVVNYLAIPDLLGDEPLDARTTESVLNAWASRTSGG